MSGRFLAAVSLGVAAVLGGAVVAASSDRQPASDLDYVVAETGDTYFKIARDRGLACNGTQLWAANGRAPLDPGTIVFIPPSCDGEVAPPPPPPPPPTTPPTTPSPGAFPTAATAGVPAGWTPKQTVSSLNVTTAGAVIEDIRVNGSITVSAPNVTIRRVEVVGGTINNWPGSRCNNGMVVDSVTIRRGTAATTDAGTPAIGDGGYTARNVKIDGMPEGFRVGGKSGGCGPVTIENSYANIVSPDICNDWHGDGLQGYDGDKLTLRNSVMILVEKNGCGGTAPFFYPDQGNTSVDIDGLIVKGGGSSFRLATPGSVKGLKIVDRSWFYSPTSDLRCSVVTAWDAQIVTLDASGQPVRVRDLACG